MQHCLHGTSVHDILELFRQTKRVFVVKPFASIQEVGNQIMFLIGISIFQFGIHVLASVFQLLPVLVLRQKLIFQPKETVSARINVFLPLIFD